MFSLRKFLGWSPRASRTGGFTLIEAVVVIAIIGVVSASTFGIVRMLQLNAFDSEVQDTLATLRAQQADARTVDANREYGMGFSATALTAFWRDPASGTQTVTKTISLKHSSVTTSVTPSATQVVFERLTGKPKDGADVTLTFTRTSPGRTRVLRIEPSGVMYVQ